MNTLYFHLVDWAHGIVMAVLLYFIFRLLIFRQQGVLRLRYIAAGMLLIAIMQIVIYFLQEFSGESGTFDTISLAADLIAAIVGIGFLWLFYRNRHLYPASVLLTGGGTLIAIMLSYIFCAIFQFAEWTYIIYLLFSTAGWILFSITIERIPDTGILPEQQPVPHADQWSGFRQQLDEVMRRDQLFCNEELTREDVCRAMHTNRTTLSLRLKEAYDKTFSEYLRDMRLTEAARLLRETDMPIDQVAFCVGLKSASGFYRNFLLTYGMTPTQYRTKHKTGLKDSTID